MKKSQIGFKACLDKEDKEKSNIEMPSPAEIEENVEQRMIAEREYEEHMTNYHKLIKQNSIFKMIGYGILAVIIASVIYIIGYNNGAEDQINDNGPYVKITEANTGKTHIILKK